MLTECPLCHKNYFGKARTSSLWEYWECGNCGTKRKLKNTEKSVNNNMENQTCVQCNMPLVLKPAGVAKATGKPYDAFLACSSGQRHIQPRKYAPQPSQAPVSPVPPQNAMGVVFEEKNRQNPELMKIDLLTAILKAVEQIEKNTRA